MSAKGLLEGWENAVAAGELRFPRCTECGIWNWYPMPVCRHCQSDRMNWVTVPPEGHLYSWTRVHRAFGGAAVADLPYVIGVVSIDHAENVRLVCLQGDSTPPVVGTPVRLAPGIGPRGPRWTFLHPEKAPGLHVAK